MDFKKHLFLREEFLVKRCFMPFGVTLYKEISINPES
jgi:hypothetical protein